MIDATLPAWKRRLSLTLRWLVIAAVLITIPVILLEARGENGPTVVALDWAIWCVFVAEYLILLCIVDDRRAFVRSNLLSAAVIVISFPLLPGLLSVVRLARLARLARGVSLVRLLLVAARGFQELRVVLARKGLVYVAAVSTLLVVVGGGMLARLEPERVEGGGFLAGIWWAVVTASTVGYGDIAPSTLGGRLVALVVMLAGIGLISTLAASITAHFVEQDEPEKLRAVYERLDRIEALLRAQAAGLNASSESSPEEPSAGATERDGPTGRPGGTA